MLETYADAETRQVAVLSRTQVTALLEAGRISGSDGCNSYTGAYTVHGPALRITQPMGMTLMACDEPVMEQASAIMGGLQSTAYFEIDGQRLTLTDADRRPRLVFVAASGSLAGTRWQAIAVNNGRQALVGVIDLTELTAEFGEDGTISGSAGCNLYGGTYSAEGKRISLATLAATARACFEPEGVAEQETAFLSALRKATVYDLRGPNLTLRDDQGATQVMFVRR